MPDVDIILKVVAAIGGVSGVIALLSFRQAKRQAEAELEKTQAIIEKTRAEWAATLAGGYSVFAGDLQEDRERLQLEVNGLAGRMLDYEKNQNALEETIRVALDRIRELDEEKSALLIRVAELEKKEKESVAEIKALKAEIKALKEERAQLLARIDELEKCKGEQAEEIRLLRSGQNDGR